MIGVGCVEFDGFRVGVFALRLVAQVAYGLLVEVRVASVDEVEGRCCGWFRHSIQSRCIGGQDSFVPFHGLERVVGSFAPCFRPFDRIVYEASARQVWFRCGDAGKTKFKRIWSDNDLSCTWTVILFDVPCYGYYDHIRIIYAKES